MTTITKREILRALIRIVYFTAFAARASFAVGPAITASPIPVVNPCTVGFRDGVPAIRTGPDGKQKTAVEPTATSSPNGSA